MLGVGVEPRQPGLQLIDLLVLLTDPAVDVADLRANAAILQSAHLRSFVNHGDFLNVLPGIAAMIHKSLREAGLVSFHSTLFQRTKRSAYCGGALAGSITLE